MEKYGKSPAMSDLPKVKADNKRALAKLKKNGVKPPMVAAKKDKRTKEELIKLLEITQGNLSKLTQMSIQRSISPPVVIAPDSEQYKAGYEAAIFEKGYKDCLKPWWAFWR